MMNRIRIDKCEYLIFVCNNISYSIKGCNHIKNIALQIEKKDFDIYDDYGARVDKRKTSLIESIKSNGLHEDIRTLVQQECPECCL